MHLKAIQIKESLLGLEDYEVIFQGWLLWQDWQCIPFQVALSVGHLASLYNYDMEQYDKVSLDLLSFFFFALYTNGRSVSCQ